MDVVAPPTTLMLDTLRWSCRHLPPCARTGGLVLAVECAAADSEPELRPSLPIGCAGVPGSRALPTWGLAHVGLTQAVIGPPAV